MARYRHSPVRWRCMDFLGIHCIACDMNRWSKHKQSTFYWWNVPMLATKQQFMLSNEGQNRAWENVVNEAGLYVSFLGTKKLNLGHGTQHLYRIRDNQALLRAATNSAIDEDLNYFLSAPRRTRLFRSALY